MSDGKMYKLTDENGQDYLSPEKGTLGGNGKDKIYGRMDCPTANAALRGQYGDAYVRHRVFFKDEAVAIAAGFRPCGNCMREHYKLWKEGKIIPGNLEETKKNLDFLLIGRPFHGQDVNIMTEKEAVTFLCKSGLSQKEAKYTLDVFKSSKLSEQIGYAEFVDGYMMGILQNGGIKPMRKTQDGKKQSTN